MISVVVSISGFVILKLFPIFMEIVDLHGCMLILGGGCVFGFFFIHFAMKETSGQSLDDIGADEQLKSKRFHVKRVNSIS